jgi:Zinc carboxypeptidase
VALVVAPGGAGTPMPAARALPSETATLTIAGSRERCPAGLARGATGVTTHSWTAAASGAVTVRLLGGEREDWDVALFDAAGRRVAGSAAFGANEVVQAGVRAGERLLVQACRLSGTARSIALRIDPVWLAPRPFAERASLLEVRGDRATFNSLVAAGLDLGEDGRGGTVSVIGRSPADLSLLRRTRLPYRVVVPDLLAADRAMLAAPAPRARSALPSGRTTYRLLEDYQQELKAIVAGHPAIARGLTMPAKSFQGRDISGGEFAAPLAGSDDGRPTFFLVGLHHSREWPAAELAMEFAHLLADGYPGDPAVRALLKKVRVVIFPFQNPDGFVASRMAAGAGIDPSAPEGVVYATAAGATAVDAYHRTTCSGVFPASFPCDLNGGADSNRNYGPHWGTVGASSLPHVQTYRGASPFSESETENVHRVLQKLNATTVMSLHNVAGAVLRPPGVLADGPPPDEALLKALGARMAAATGYPNTTFAEGLGYDGSGITEDWAYGALGAFTYTIEIGGTDFHGDYAEHVVDQWTGGTDKPGKGARAALLAIAQAALDPANHGILSAAKVKAGRTLRLRKQFTSMTGAPCGLEPDLAGGAVSGCASPGAPIALPDSVELTMTVPRSGKVAWHVPPSTRPFERRAGKTESYVFTCERAGKVMLTRTIVVARGQTLRLGRIRC